ncbi:hypothetical protein PC9H_003949 [Pleurotus ostreatus]|uniref:3'-5' exonuclease domain-containing protein n=1 Tax=Pleurotus ostreatus TaxID=5322 RepID=A0A8H7A6R8_PLEOS|nr:uncharacterized protein PC9H_003949 [Pleurotus ostreatus]KAF7437115.1 hypothetical protein PC9H_003949 [Pleurotus ostreatus]
MSDSFSEAQTVTELASEAGASAVTESPNPDAPPPRPKPTKLYSWRARNPDAKLLYIRDVDIANLELDRMSTLPAIGFDQEWKPTFIKGLPENPVSLIQLASDELVLLIQVSAMNEIPEKLIQILENPDIVKAGVGIQGDVHKLYKDHKVDVKNCVDLSLLARSADNPRWKGKYSSSIGLSRLIEEYEDETLQKGRITRSNWEAVLSPAQQIYAANDAHAGLTLYNRLGAMARGIDTLKPVYYTFDCVRGRLCEPSGAQWYAWNPNYDPGPPPPPRPPKPPKIKEFPLATNTTTITSPSPLTLSSSSSPSSAHPISGPSSTNTTIVSTNTNSHTPANVNNFTKASRSGLTKIQVLVTAMLHTCRDAKDLVQRHHRAKLCPFLSNIICGLIAPMIVGMHPTPLLLGDSRNEEGVAEEEEEAKREPKFPIPNQMRSRLPGADAGRPAPGAQDLCHACTQYISIV